MTSRSYRPSVRANQHRLPSWARIPPVQRSPFSSISTKCEGVCPRTSVGTSNDPITAIQAASARHEELTALREEAESLSEALATRKLVERAKGLLMERESLTEREAFGRLRRASQVSGRPMRVVAEALIATFQDA